MNRNLGLFVGTRQALARIEHIVLGCAFDEAEDDWSEVDRTYEGDQGYVSFAIATDPGEAIPCVRVELGVQDEASRHPTAGFKAQWNREEGAFAQVQSVIVDGHQCPPAKFLRRLEGALADAGVSASMCS